MKPSLSKKLASGTVAFVLALVTASPVAASNDGSLDAESLGSGLYDFGIDYWYVFLIAGSVLLFVLGVLVVMMIVRKDKENAPMISSTKKEDEKEGNKGSQPPAPKPSAPVTPSPASAKPISKPSAPPVQPKQTIKPAPKQVVPPKPAQQPPAQSKPGNTPLPPATPSTNPTAAA